ncbi:MAG: NRDE family protein [Deltaproteobacteria bacterium]|jgi:uncharacterized protein with NRDE domain|nr:NRDE family protein [Deltaproteobacteria bacterium]MBT4527182.1 NRDE family protein [Deltaproteobacteria bacterium]
MCLILIAYQTHPKYPLILLANRDEFYSRPTAQASFWSEDPEILGGKDLQAGGTWMGINKSGNIAALTNYRSLDNKQYAKSRGELVSNFIKNKDKPETYLNQMSKLGKEYAGYNLLIGHLGHLLVFSNINNQIHQLKPGFHGLSNRFLNSGWFKVKKGKQALAQLISEDKIERKLFLKVLQDRQAALDKDLPNTGFTKEQEKMLSPLFIESPAYGTRCSTIITIDYKQEVTFFELTYQRGIQPEGVEFQFQITSG